MPSNSKQLSHCLHLLEKNVLSGNCLIAELYRLSLTTPSDFLNHSASPFAKLLIDFSYFENRQSFENYTEHTEEGRQYDEKFFSAFSLFLRNYAQFLDKLYTFIIDFVNFTTDYATLREQFSRVKRLEEFELLSAQLLYLLGLLLLLLDFKFHGSLRERIFVALYRLRVDFDSNKLQTLVDLLRNRREPFETCFTTLGLDEHFISQIFTFLRFYKGSRNGGWLENALYVCLYFDHGHYTLNNEFSIMRQIIDNFFADRCILHMHIDFRVNLYEKWDRFKAASAALSSTIDLNQGIKHASEHLHRSIRAFPLPTGLLSLEKFGEYAKSMIDLNDRLKWLILHSSIENFTVCNKKFANILSKEAHKEMLIGLKQLAYFEFKFGQASAHLRANREESVNKLRQRIADNFAQILAFLRNSPATTNRRTERLISWLDSIRIKVDEIGAFNSTDTLERFDHLRSRINEVIQLQSDGMDQQQLILRQSLIVARSDLQRFENICAFDDEAIEELTRRTESTYLFRFIDENCPQMEQMLREDALSVKFIFLKMANSISSLIYGKIDDLAKKRLASFYYKVLEVRLRSVIQAIPRAIFEEMSKLNQYFSTDSQSVSVEKARIKEFADLPRRRKLAELTYQISRLALGIANTCLKQLGDVQIQPRALLCDGLRNELDKRLGAILSESGQHSMFRLLQIQLIQLQHFRKAFLFVCDHVGIRDGVQIWTEQLHLAMKRDVAKKFAKITAKPPIGPSTAVTPSAGDMVIGRFFDFSLAATKPTNCIYNQMDSTWRSLRDSQTIKFTYMAFSNLDIWMLFGLGTLFGLVLDKEIQELSKILNKKQFISGSGKSTQIPLFTNPVKIRQILTSSTDFLIDGPNQDLVKSIARLGQLRLLLTNLQMFMQAEAHSQLGVVHRARSIFAKSIKWNYQPFFGQPEKLQQLFSSQPAELIEILPKLIRLKNVKSHVFLLSTILHFSMLKNTASNKKREFLDATAVIQGAIILLEQSPLWAHFLGSMKEDPVNSKLSLLTPAIQ